MLSASKNEKKEIVDPSMDVDTEPEVVDNKGTKKGKRKRTFKLYNYEPPEGRAGPKNGGKYSSSTPSLAAKKCANRWICEKKKFEEVTTFYLREIGRLGKDGKPLIYEFKAKRVKLTNPKTYKRGEREITVDSKIVLV